MKALIATLALSLTSVCFADTSMNLEGTCRGTRTDGTVVAFSYYSDFDGCKQQSKAAIVFSEGGALSTGKRSLKNDRDSYAFTNTKLDFEDSTGISGGTLIDESGEKIAVQCEIRDYEYAGEC